MVRVVTEQGEQLGVMPLKEARAVADGRGLDLVEVDPDSMPPVCRIMDYGKFKYRQKKKTQQSRKKTHISQVKEVRIKPKTGEHDIMFKVKQARQFLEQGDKVQVNMTFRGREITHIDVGRSKLERFSQELVDIAKIEKGPKMEGKVMVLLFSRK